MLFFVRNEGLCAVRTYRRRDYKIFSSFLCRQKLKQKRRKRRLAVSLSDSRPTFRFAKIANRTLQIEAAPNPLFAAGEDAAGGYHSFCK
jgi:hypothetical protein